MRDKTVDIGKFIAAILVVLIHTPIFDEAGSLIWQFDVILRLAVPFFIVCSGYYLGKRLQIDDGKIATTKCNTDMLFSFCKKMCGIYIIWSILYLLVSIPGWVQSGWFSPMAFVDWGIAAVLQGAYYHLWYILYMIYAVVILAVFLKRLPMRIYPHVIVVLYMIEVAQYGYRGFLPEIAQNILGIFDILPCLSSITRVLPLLMVGMYVACNRNTEEKASRCFIGLVFTLMFLVIERNILVGLGCEKVSYIFFTLPVSYLLFKTLVSIKWKEKGIDTKKLSDVSTYVYLIHPMYIVWIYDLLEETIIINALIVIVLSIISSYVIVLCKDAIRHTGG